MRRFEDINWSDDYRKYGVSVETIDNACTMYVQAKLFPEFCCKFKKSMSDALYKINQGVRPEPETEDEREAAEEAYWQEQESFPVKSMIRGTRHDQAEGERKRLRRIEPWTMSVRTTHNGRGIVHEGDRMAFNWKRHDRRLARRKAKAECRAF